MKDQKKFEDFDREDRKQAGAQKYKNNKQHKESEKRMHRVGNGKNRWRFDPNQLHDEDYGDDYFDEEQEY